MKPPFTITQAILSLCADIARIIGRYEGLQRPTPQPQLRRKNRIRSIQSSLAIEGNRLSLDQVSAILNHQRIIGPKKEVLEVTNAIAAYDRAGQFQSTSIRSLCAAHAILMQGLIADAGHFRKGDIGILQGSRVRHVAPRPKTVPQLMERLFTFLAKDTETLSLVKACIFHYEFEFIHPFSDGNGRMGRLWQHVLLCKYHPLFEYVPVESVIKARQKAYYKALERSDHDGHSTVFIEFMLRAMFDSVQEFLDALRPEPQTPERRLSIARAHFANRNFSRKDYLALFKTLSSATASRDLRDGVATRQLQRTGDKALAQYRFFD